MATKPADVSDLAAASLKKLDAAVEAARRSLAKAETERADFCRRWGEANGFRVFLSADQVRRCLPKAPRP